MTFPLPSWPGHLCWPYIPGGTVLLRQKVHYYDAIDIRIVASGRGVSEFEQERVSQTLAELGDSYKNLEDVWTRPEKQANIPVHFLGSIEEYHELTRQNRAGAHVICTETGPMIFLPLEDAPTGWSEDYSRTPAHETVHALMCQSLGYEAGKSIPPWFNEGMAQFYAEDGFLSRSRINNRTRVWWNRKNLMIPEEFCEHEPWTDDNRRRLFYPTSLEFMRALEERHTMKTINLIVEDVRKGQGFETSMKSRLGGNCFELYEEWINSF